MSDGFPLSLTKGPSVRLERKKKKKEVVLVLLTEPIVILCTAASGPVSLALSFYLENALIE